MMKKSCITVNFYWSENRAVRNFNFFRIFITISCLLFSFSFNSCDTDKKPEDVRIDSTSSKNDSIIFNPFPLVKYRLDTIKDRQELISIIKNYRKTPQNYSAYRAFITLNRKELRYINVGSAVVIPDTIINDLRAYSIFPNYYEGAKNIKKLVVVSNVYQSYGCYEYGKLVRFTAINSGKERTPSYPGRYAMNWKEKVHRSSIDSNWSMPYTINIHMQAGSAMHNFEMPGKPASHSCIRQFYEDAEWIYYWGDRIKTDPNRNLIPMSGTPIIIIDYYDFNPGKGYRWKYLKDNHERVITLPDNPMGVEEALIPISQIPKEARGGLVNRWRYIHAEDSLRARGVIRQGVKLIETKNYNKLRRIKQRKELQRLELEKQKSNPINQ